MNTSQINNVSKKDGKQTRSRNTAPKEKKITKIVGSTLKEKEKDEKLRSGSLSRQIHLKAQESPRKAQSLDRSITSKKMVKETLSGATSKKSSVENVKKQVKSNIANVKHDSRKSHVANSKSNVKNDQKKSSENPLRTSKTTKPKTNLQIAKSFVHSSKNVSKQSTKESKQSKKVLLKDSENLPVKDLNENNLERPRTSTIRKGPMDSLNTNDDIGTNKNGNKSESDQPRPKSKNSMGGHSDSDRASYEDDFEDYDSDFEASDPVSISESDYSEEEDVSDQDYENKSENLEPENLSNSMPELKQPVIMSKRSTEKTFLKMSDRSSLFSEKKTSSVETSSIKPSRSFINFETAMTPDEDISDQKELNPSPNRFKSLKDELDINKVMKSFHENYKLVGKSTSKQVCIQTENCEAEETQTDEIELTNKWTQNPSNGTTGSGGDQVSTNSNVSTALRNLFYVNSTKLSTFLQRSSNIILTLIEEEFASSDSQSRMEKSSLKYCNGYHTISPPSFLSGVPVISISSAYDLPYIITIHGDLVQLPFSENDDEKGIVCVWNIFQFSNPEYILTANSQPACGTFGPNGSDIVIGGMVDGAIMLWDLSDLMVKNVHLGSGDAVSFRSPTYNTAAALGTENHCSCIVGIQSVYKSAETNWQSSGFDNSDRLRSFHVLTLEDMGVLNIWVVVEVMNPDRSGLESDLGLAPGGKFRLVKSAGLILHSLPTLQLEQRISIRTFDFRLVPHDSSKILVTTDAGIILHVTRHSGFAEPRYYYSESEFNSEIRCIDCSPHNNDLFLVGCSDGCIKLYNIKFVRPLFEFMQTSKGDQVILIQWSIVDPSVFCILTSSSHIHLYNLMENMIHPVFSNHFEDSKITWFVFNKQKRPSNATTNERFYPNLIIAKESGDIEVHKLQKIIKQDYETQLEFMKNL